MSSQGAATSILLSSWWWTQNMESESREGTGLLIWAPPQWGWLHWTSFPFINYWPPRRLTYPTNWHTNLLWGLDVARALLKPTHHPIVSSGFPSLWIPSRAVTLVSPIWGSMLPFLHMHTHTCRGSQVTAQQKFDFVLWSSISHEVPTKMELPWQYQMPFYQKHSLELNCRNDYDNV